MITEDSQNNPVDKIFRDGLQFHKDQPSKDLWTRIGADLDKDNELTYLSKKRRNLLFISGLMLAMIGLGIIYIKNSNTHFRFIQVEKANSSPKRQANPSAIIQDLTSKPKANNWVSFNGNVKPYNNSLTKYRIPLSENSTDSEQHTSTNEAEYSKNSVTIQTQETKFGSIQTNQINFIPQKISLEKTLVKAIAKSPKNKLSLTVFFSQEFAGYNLSDDDATAADGREIEKRERNAFSASMGMYLNYRINRRWVVQTGLSYSLVNKQHRFRQIVRRIG